ncbi:2,3-bisphosphoglycerate-independent phosphoglycerate mutase [Leeuwenhoekiella marinoflava]|uniref:2,3-bisphosphoglycerate-independent phosphoglycerate mutase n=2 Tax=Leeuwenhoekiella marinoflava TaxID=988 RepID=A0A4Q0PI97_9FLAO|nr:2,3-bisphosphoglycerate-independent phosphoglycerate mutase [Leeuwenhoekiella marinoflava]RXG26837.1 phosphoglycerate mutase [Leeuwenhoekiella marinoflava]SHF39026.1 phosphoglycerate mutase [Leeuwenhoekiella marinoflava DSM 3653]
MNKKVILMILDGWGFAPNKEVSAVDQANTPFIDSLYTKYPHAQLLTHGGNVGLPDGQMGNSEVGHMNLGAGRIVYQDFAKINKALKENTLRDQKELKDAFAYAKENKKPIHLLGLVSDGGVHAHIKHVKGLIKAAREVGVEDIYIHAFTDGRDVDPQSGAGFIEDLNDYATNNGAKLASITGRYFAMDRDTRWERVKKAYDAAVKGVGTKTTDPVSVIKASYKDGVTDEFLEPIIVTENDQPVATIKDGDVVLFFNYRTDRGRELTRMLSQEDFPEQDTQKLDLYYVTMTNYDQTFKNIHIIFDKDNLTNTLGEVVSKAGKKQIRIAETEKYPHVTFFFSGGREQAFEGETRLIAKSPNVATYDLQPEMSAYEVRDKIVAELKKEEVDFVCLNFANPDMVGHTGILEAAIKACEAVDACAKDVIETGIEHGYSSIVIADHGNCETMKNEDGSPNTAHTINPVPIIVVDNDIKIVKDGILGNVSPTILNMMGIDKPAEMDQESLVS